MAHGMTATLTPQVVTARKRVTLLGVTGSIGTQAAALIQQYPDRFAVEVITAQQNDKDLVAMAHMLNPRQVVIGDESAYGRVKDALAGTGIRVAAGREALIEAASQPVEVVLAGIMGVAGLEPVLAAVRQGASVAIANKEPLVSAGALIMREAAVYGATILPVDSEHNAIFQVFDTEHRSAIASLTLTASGGPFRTMTLEAMRNVTPQQAVSHPNWSMGAKISVDSATMMNKGLECIEAHHLFSIAGEQIEVLVHPESIVHGLVSYVDGTVKAVLSPPDMTTPIAYALAWPERIAVPDSALDLAKVGALHFEAPDMERFPALGLALQAMQAGGAAPIVLNAANEIAVQAFLSEKIGFLEIAEIVSRAIDKISEVAPIGLDDIIALDQKVRLKTAEIIA